MSGFALVHSRALLGLQAPSVHVEVHLANGLPSFTLVGLADTEVKEARERVRSAIANAGLEFPSNKRITVNLAPADLPKDSGRFDLPIAMGILAASGQIDGARLHGYEFAGELSLSGDLRPVRGALAMALATSHTLPQQRGDATHADRAGHALTRLVLPEASAKEAALVPDAHIYPVKHLLDVVAQFAPQPQSLDETQATPTAEPWTRLAFAAPVVRPNLRDMADVKGQSAAKRALEIAAAGGHSVLMVGPPGSGKSMLAQRFASLLPPMSTQQALESAAVLSLAGKFKVEHWAQRVVQSPHHTASAVALVGGGSPPRPGEISLAHEGVLFLDELPEFPRSALEALREPLESGTISISRAAQRSEFPARFQLVAAMNPCPCGYLGSRLKACRCTPDQVARYQGKLSGPLMDRIDIHIEVAAMASEELLQAGQGEPSTAVALRVQAAQARSVARQGKPNHSLMGQEIEAHVALDDAARTFLNTAATRLGWSGRSTHRALKVARTIADLVSARTVQITHIAEAIQYRRVLRGS
ncbi:MAG: YifB family Mg chelatase-like AAA ATPase [Burkholderiaceae bacterium]